MFTRCRPWRKNDQAFVEQKNGAVVRHMVGYRRLEGPEAVAALSRLYATARLFVNFFQPSFSWRARRATAPGVRKRYHLPGDALPTAAGRSPHFARRSRRGKRAVRLPRPDPSAEGHETGATAPGRSRRQGRHRARGCTIDRRVPRRLANGLEGRRGAADGETSHEAETRPPPTRSSGGCHRSAAGLVRSRAVAHQPPTA